MPSLPGGAGGLPLPLDSLNPIDGPPTGRGRDRGGEPALGGLLAMPEADWIMVRIRRETRVELERVRDSMRDAEDRGLVELPHDDRDRVSLDAIIRRLIEFRARHARRRQESAARRARRRQQIGQSLPTPASGQETANIGEIAGPTG
jgi:hypothetical protein